MIQLEEGQEKEFNQYLRKYEKIYRTKRGEDWGYVILCFPKKPNADGSFTSICPYSLAGDTKLLLYSLFCPKSAHTKESIKRNMTKAGIWFKVTQEGDAECCIAFKEQDLPKLVKILKIQKKKIYSQLRIEHLREHIAIARAGKNREVKNG